MGVYFTTVMTTVEGDETREFESNTTTGWGAAVPAGLALSFSKNLFLNAQYTLNWLWSNTALENDLLHMATVGVGINFGP